MKRYKKSNWLPAMLFIYATAMAVYFVPRNNESTDTEKFLLVFSSYLIIFLLWISLRAQEKRRDKRENDLNNSHKNNQ